MMDGKMLKVCIIGAGMIAKNGHIPAYQTLGNQLEIKGIYAPNPQRGKEAAEKCCIPKYYSDAREMLETEKPDLVSICVPNQMHEEMVNLALDMGTNVICEKPLSLSYKATTELYKKAEENNLTLCACHNFRFVPEYREIRRLVQRKELGQIYYGEFSWIRSRGVPDWGHFCSKSANGGGAFADIGVHSLDLMLWLMGSPKVLAVSGHCSDLILHGDEYPNLETDVEEFASGSISLENNMALSFKTAWCANMPDERKFLLLGNKCGVSFPECKIHSGNGKSICTTQLGIETKEIEYPNLQFPNHLRLIKNVIEHITMGTELLIKPEESINTAAAIELFYKSCDMKKEAEFYLLES